MSDFDSHALMKELGGLTASVQNVDKKLTEYCYDNKIQNRDMWSKIDSHSRKINWFMGGMAVVSSAITYTVIAFKHKIFGGS